MRGASTALAILLSIALGATPAASAFAASPPDEGAATDLLRAAMAAPAHVSYVGEVQTLRFGAQQSEAAIYRIEHRSPNLTRRWYVAPQDLFGDSIISRGETTYSIDVKRNRIVVNVDDAIDDQVGEDDNFGLLSANYRTVFAPNETVAGRQANVVMLTNRYTGQSTMRVYIDSQTKLVLQKEQFSPTGSVVMQTRFEQIRYTNNIPAAIFNVPKLMAQVKGSTRGMPSSDLQRLMKTAGFNAKGPKYLPEGFLPVEGNVVDVKGVRTFQLLYSDGIRTVSLFENAKGAAVDMTGFHPKDAHVENHEAQYVEEGPTTLLAWSEDGLHFALVGELNRSELEKIAASVVL